MEESKREVKHTVLIKFKEGVTEEKIEECIKQFSKTVVLIPSIKDFQWGKEMGIVNLNQGFTHIFESTFESAEAVVANASNPLHIYCGSLLKPLMEKFVVIDFQPKKLY